MHSAAAFLHVFIKSQFTILLTALVALVIAGVAKLLAVVLLLDVGVPRSVLQGQDALITGVLTAAFVWFFLQAERARQREQEAQVKVVADLNHHLRNALAVILGSEYLRQSDKAAAILESVERIDNALTMIVGPRPTKRTTITKGADVSGTPPVTP